ncbi:hypothetical protein EZS27_010291 [termite gut metagenome]|uniref:Transmembrane protein n=1 Tax=termite gut metagenome TaxID=433724 RepID=A0A5J4S938_9ZZZZ
MMPPGQIQKAVTTSRYTLPVVIILSLLFWLAPLFVLPDLPEKEISYAAWKTIHDFCFPLWTDKVFCIILYFVIGYFLSVFNNQFGLIRMRVTVPASLFFLSLSVWPGSYTLYAGNIAALMFLISIYYLFESYQQYYKSSGYLFHAGLFTGIGSLLYPQLTCFIPVLIIGAYSFRSLSVRSFFALLIGWGMPYWFLLGYAFPAHRMDLFYQPFMELVNFRAIGFKFQLWEWITLGGIFILCVVSSIHSYVTSYMDKIRTRVFLRFFMILNLCIFLFIILQPDQCTNLLPLLLVGASILGGHLFVLSNSDTSAGFFICFWMGLFSLFAFNMWMLLSNV